MKKKHQKKPKEDKTQNLHEEAESTQPIQPLTIPMPTPTPNEPKDQKEEEKITKPKPQLPPINIAPQSNQQTYYSRKFNNTTGYLHSSLSCPTLNFQLSKTGFVFRKLSFLKKIHIKPTRRRSNGIPNTLLERLKLFASIFKEESFIQYYELTPPRTSANSDRILRHIAKSTGRHGELDTFAMIFYYICNQITYDTEPITDTNRESNLRPENILKTGSATTEGFASLFECLCKFCKLGYKRIEGYCKHFGFKVGHSCNGVNHSWHRVRIKNEWYLCDVMLGSGGGNHSKDNQGQSLFNPYYFLTPPELLIDSHRPIEDDMQMIPKTVILKHFASKSNHSLGEFYQKVYASDIELLSHDYPVISIPEKQVLSITIRIQEVALQANLYTASGRTKLSELKYITEENGTKFTFEVKFPSTGNYVVSIISRAATSTDLIYYPLINYSVRVGEEYTFKRQLKSLGRDNERRGKSTTDSVTLLQRPLTLQGVVKIINGKEQEKPVKKICLDNGNAYLFEPRSSVLRIGTETRFKVKIKGAVAAIVLDGRKWNYLKKKEEDIWEGVTVIQTEHLSICALKNSNVFTEVFLFKATKGEQKKK